MKNKIKIILIVLVFILNSCSSNLLNFKTENEKLNFRIIRKELSFNIDSLKINLITYLNERKVKDEIICQINAEINTGSKFLSSLFSNPNTEYRFIYEDGYPLRFNQDSSFALLTIHHHALFNISMLLYVININNCSNKFIGEFESGDNSSTQWKPPGNRETKYVDVGSPAKWLDNSKFILGTDEGIYLYNINSLENPLKMMEADVYSNFLLTNTKLINQSPASIELIDYANKTTSELSDESGSSGLKKTGNYYYFIKSRSLYRGNIESFEKPLKIHEADYLIKEYWIIDDNQFIIRCGPFTETPEPNCFYLFNINNDDKISIDDNINLENSFLSSDKKYFVLKKKTTRIHNYDVLLVFDLEKRIKYEFDFETVPE